MATTTMASQTAQASDEVDVRAADAYVKAHAPAFAGTRFLVIVSERHWKKVADTLGSYPEARCMIEGSLTIYRNFTGIAVAATSCTAHAMCNEVELFS